MTTQIKRLSPNDMFLLSRQIDDAPFNGAPVERERLIRWMNGILNRSDITKTHANTFASAAGIQIQRKSSAPIGAARSVLVARMVIELGEALGHEVPEWWRMAARNDVSNDQVVKMINEIDS